jgi:pantoate--beta-alanine ligase
METADSITRMKAWRRGVFGSVGFVPTMGYLHEGHISLVKQSRKENDVTAVSIFVNPTQFGPKEDFKTYPRDTDRDLRLLKEVGTDVVFMPSAEEMYPPNYSTWVDVEKLTSRLEGEVRPGHFRGVTTVVNKLFNIVEPTRSYFGQKDAQQALVLRKMAVDLNMNLEVIVLPTVREPDGLAMSSRNVYLDEKQRKAAVILYKSLTMAAGLRKKGEKDAAKIRQKMTELIKSEPLGTIDYISIADTATLDELEEIKGEALVSLAVRFGRTRLIDNFII